MQSEEKGTNGFDKDIKYSLCKPEFKSSEIQTRYFLVLFGGNYKTGSATGKNVQARTLELMNVLSCPSLCCFFRSIFQDLATKTPCEHSQ